MYENCGCIAILLTASYTEILSLHDHHQVVFSIIHLNFFPIEKKVMFQTRRSHARCIWVKLPDPELGEFVGVQLKFYTP